MITIGTERAGDNPVSRLIAGFDAPGDYSHAALFFDGNLRFDAHIDYGVRFNEATPDPERWALFNVPLTTAEEANLRRWCELNAGAGYDSCGVLSIARVPFMKQDPERWFCSELAVSALQSVGYLLGRDAWTVSPNALSLWAAEAFPPVAENVG